MCISIRIALAVALISSSGCSESTTQPGVQMASQARIHLDSLVTLMERNALNRSAIDWTAFRRDVLAAGAGATSLEGITPAIELAIRKLADEHTYYTRGSLFVFVTNRDCTSADPPPVVRSADIGYVRIGSNAGLTGAQLTAFAQSIQDSIRLQDSDNIRGWIVDLRRNSGGEMFSMVTGAGPILGDGVAGYFLDRSSNEWSWDYVNGTSHLGATTAYSLASPYRVKRQNPPVAVLTGVSVTSGGEAIAASFKSRPNTRFFGGATCGRTTGLTTYQLPDGGTLHLAIAFMADRTKKIFEGPIQPDEIITDPTLLVQRARAWLATR